MADIFISYASEDRSRVEPLAKALEDQGWQVWWDRIIPPGKSFDQVIQEEITASKCVVVVWSTKSIKSDWVKEEATIGKRRRILVPALIDSVEPPFGFGLIQAADLTDWNGNISHAGFKGFLGAISDIFQPQSPTKSDADASATTEPKSYAPRKTSKATKFVAAAVIIALLILGIWWRGSRQQVNEVRQELQKPDRQALNLKAKVAKLDKPEKIDDATPKDLTIVSVGGPFSKGQLEAIQKPFTRNTGIKINNTEVYDDGLAKLKDQVLKGDVGWDLVTLDKHQVGIACEAGLIEPVDWSILSPAPDGTPAVKDFISGALHQCGVATFVWATIIAYDKTRFAGDTPSKLVDFFDVKKFPGMRAVSNHPAGTLELALMADGVPVEEVYQTLSTKEGLDLAFKKLDTIKEILVFWDASAQPADMLADGEVVMTTAYNSRIFDAQIKMEKPFVIIWDHQIYGMDYYSLIKSTKNKKSAAEYLKFATTSHALADQASWEPYGPTRKSSIPLVKTYHGTDIKMAPHLPTSPDNFRNGLALDYEWWAEKQDIMLNRFKIWMLK